MASPPSFPTIKPLESTLTPEEFKEMMESLRSVQPLMPPSAFGGLASQAFNRMSEDSTRKFTDSNMHGMLASRMGWNINTPRSPFDRCFAYKLSDEKAVIFIIHAGKAVTIEDDLNPFPSDALVTQLRLLGSK